MIHFCLYEKMIPVQIVAMDRFYRQCLSRIGKRRNLRLLTMNQVKKCSKNVTAFKSNFISIIRTCKAILRYNFMCDGGVLSKFIIQRAMHLLGNVPPIFRAV